MPRPHHNLHNPSATISASSTSKRRRPQGVEEGGPDTLHNRDHPCCQELANICQQVLQAGPPHLSSRSSSTSTTTTTTSATNSSSSLPTLPELIWHYLTETVHTDVTLANNTNGASASAAKKKRKKKKKNKRQDESPPTEGVIILDPETTVMQVLPPDPQTPQCRNTSHPSKTTLEASVIILDPETTVIQVLPPDPQTPQCRNISHPSKTTASTWTETTATYFAHRPSSLFDMIVQEYFLASSTSSSAAAATANAIAIDIATTNKPNFATQAQRREMFWRRVLTASSSSSFSSSAASSATKSNGHKNVGGGGRTTGGSRGSTNSSSTGSSINISASLTRPLVAQIACPKCRSHVSSILETEHKLVLFQSQQQHQQHPAERAYAQHSQNISMLSSPPLSSTGTSCEVEESYVRMEEGHMEDGKSAWSSKQQQQQQQQQELAFFLTVTDDEAEMVWQLRGMGLGDGDGDVCSTTAKTGSNGSEDGENADDSNDVTSSENNAAASAGDWRRVILYDYVLGRGIASSELAAIATSSTPISGQEQQQQQQQQQALPLDQNLIRGLANAVQSKVLGNEKVFRDCALVLEKQFETMREQQPNDSINFTEDNIDMLAISNLKPIDEESCAIMEHLLRLLLDMTLSLFMAASSAASGNDAAKGRNNDNGDSASSPAAWRQRDLQGMLDSVLVLWEAWVGTTQKIVQHIARYEQFLRDLADRHGQFPHFFLSPTYRQLYRDLIKAKLVAVFSLLNQLRQHFDAPLESPGLNPIDHKACMQRKILTYCVFCQHHLGMDYKRPPPGSALDEAMQHILESVRECVETPIQASWNQVQQEHEKRQERLLRRCERVFANAKTAVLSENVASVRALLALNDPDSVMDEDQTSTNHYRSNLGGATMQLVSGWVREQCHIRSHARESAVVPNMPVKLLQSMVYGNEDFNCHANAKTRAVCILVVLFYRWMSELCDTWRAELAEQDLLTSMASFEADQGSTDGGIAAAAAATGGKTKASKKKKKKKSDTSVDQAPSANIEAKKLSTLEQKNDSGHEDTNNPPSNLQEAERSAIYDRPLGEDTDGKRVLHVNSSPPSASSLGAEHDNIVRKNDNIKLPTNGKALASIEGSVCSDKSRKEKKERKKNSVNNVDDINVSTNTSEEREGRDSEAMSGIHDETATTPSLEELIAIDLSVCVGVDDVSDFQSAEDFLVGRLMAALKEQGR